MIRRIVAVVTLALALSALSTTAIPTNVGAAPETETSVSYNDAPAYNICVYWAASEFYGHVNATNWKNIPGGWNVVACHWHWYVAGFCFHTNGMYDRDDGAHVQLPIAGDNDGNPWSNCTFGTHNL